MKRLLVVLISILVGFPLMLGAILGITYALAGEGNVPSVSVKVLEQKVAPGGVSWKIPVFGGILYKDFVVPSTLETVDIGLLDVPQISAELPKGYKTKAILSNSRKTLWQGDADELANFKFVNNGKYILELQSEKPEVQGAGYGTFVFRTTFKVQIEPRIQQNLERVKQGDVLAIRLYNLLGDVTPLADTPVGTANFMKTGEGVQTCYVPVAYDREPGEYSVEITAGDYSWSVPFEVIATAFPEQDLTIDTSNETISEANSPAAYQQYKDKVTPFFETGDKTRYWRGLFLSPAQGEISTEYGLFRYTNGSTTPSRHSGLDISADEGAPVVAPAAGRVVLAEELLNTGNTIIIEHGGGLKSYYYHMSALQVATGNAVEKGQQIGAVGSTGYSTGDHLHFEVRIGNQSISPMLLIDGRSGLYFFEAEDDETREAEPAPPPPSASNAASEAISSSDVSMPELSQPGPEAPSRKPEK